MDIVAFFRKSAIKKETEKVQDNVTACCSSEKTADATEKKDCKPENKMKRKQDENYDQNYDKKKKNSSRSVQLEARIPLVGDE